jgi:hypothetical protein
MNLPQWIVVCVFCGIAGYHVGLRFGILRTLEYLRKEKLIEYED